MFREVEARNFKCFDESGVRVALAPLTIFVGPNGSGKSSILDAVSVFAQSAKPPDQQAAFVWQGKSVELGQDGELAVNCRRSGSAIVLGISFSADETVATPYWKAGLSHFKGRSFGYRVAHVPGTGDWQHELLFDDTVVARNEQTTRTDAFTTRGYDNRLEFPEIAGSTGTPTAVQARIYGKVMLSEELFTPLQELRFGQPVNQEIAEVLAMIPVVTRYMRDSLYGSVFLIGANRFPQRRPPVAPSEPYTVGKNGENTLPVLSVLFGKPEHINEAKRIQHWAEIFGLGGLTSGWIGEELLRAGYRDENAKVNLELEFAGFGSKQILPVITQLFCAPKGALILIEEPEISLHPEAQIWLLAMFADAIRDGKQIVITTHSQTLLTALPEVAKGHEMTPDQVCIYHFSREGTQTSATKLEVDKAWYIKGWVPSFSEVESHLLKSWIANVGSRIKTEP